MAITITPGVQVRLRGTFQSQENVTAVTTSATQTLPINTDVVTLNGPTATIANRYTMADGAEGQEILLVYAATAAGGTTASEGDIHVVPDNLRPQSSITFRQVDQFCLLKFVNGKWQVLDRNTFEEIRVTASGALPLTVDVARLSRVTGTDLAFTLADGLFEGQRYIIDGPSGTTPRVVTPANFRAFTTLAMGNSFARYAELVFYRGEWTLTSPLNVSVTATNYDTDKLVA